MQLFSTRSIEYYLVGRRGNGSKCKPNGGISIITSSWNSPDLLCHYWLTSVGTFPWTQGSKMFFKIKKKNFALVKDSKWCVKDIQYVITFWSVVMLCKKHSCSCLWRRGRRFLGFVFNHQCAWSSNRSNKSFECRWYGLKNTQTFGQKKVTNYNWMSKKKKACL